MVLLLVHSCKEKLAYNTDVVNEFKKIQSLGDGMSLERSDVNPVFFKYERIDTLNKSDFVDPGVKIVAIDGSPVAKENFNNQYQFYFSSMKIDGDSLVIDFSPPFQEYLLKSLIVKNSVEATLTVDNERMNSIKSNLNDSTSNKVKLNLETKSFILSQSYLNTKKGEFIYGKAQFITQPYYKKNQFFKKGYIKVRDYITCFFRVSKM
jgi:hypothetical protein